MNSNADSIKNTLDENKERLKEVYGINEIGLFGSFARGDSNELSDIDLLVDFSRPIGFFKFIELENHLCNLLGKRVDLVTKDALKSAIKEDILKEVLYV